ncbi:MAG: DEAD/DEAH box helicase [Caldiserica bacterium]|jgi:DEAD/DEAH box helicase domain-containing protein|nr:DEAD/DEAH box helicase [Caldisericota bacterium]MDH7562034.1 DEAD/DEAH box helicase [Caldisericota bacterium]
MSRISSILQDLRESLAKEGQLVHLEVLSGKPPVHGEILRPLPDSIEKILNSQGLRLYSHQGQAINLLREGKDVIIATPTASGKSLAFNIPVMESLLLDPFACALYIYPLKALANDQLKTLLFWDRHLKANFRPAIYDGDTPSSAKRRILERSRIILTNPYALHEYLPWHHLWRRVFMNLKFVIIDEAHVYRGIFGSHFSCLLRRLKRIARYYGSEPQFVLSSATLYNPQEFGEKLLGRKVEVITTDGAPRSQKFFLLWNPPLTEKGERRSPHLETRDLVWKLASSGIQVLCFTGSRYLCELLTRWTREVAEREGGLEPKKIASYRAGYLPEERRELEHRLKEKDLRVIFSTNALELGIDIGSLDAVVISGYPGTMISTWQQAGRAGRGRADSLVVLVAFPDPLDQYFAQHPERFFSHPMESALLNPQNPHVLRGHLQCAALELPFESKNEVEEVFGTPALEVLSDLEKEGIIVSGSYRGSQKRSSEIVTLNNLGTRTFLLLSEGEVIETLDLAQVYREAYPGAVFLHQGETFLVQKIEGERGLIHLSPVEVDYYTQPRKDTEVRIKKEIKRRITPEGIEVFLGEVEVCEQLLGYYVKKFDRVLDFRDLLLPPLTYSTIATWFLIPQSLKEEFPKTGFDFEGSLHALEHSMIALTPIFALCDRWDLGGVSYPHHPELDAPAVFIYDGAPGGVGIAEKVFEVLPELIKVTWEMVRDCPCEEGCPSCVLSPKCGNNNQPMSKGGAIFLLERLKRGGFK